MRIRTTATPQVDTVDLAGQHDVSLGCVDLWYGRCPCLALAGVTVVPAGVREWTPAMWPLSGWIMSDY